ncbi:hypothetical protein AAHZ94_16345 [Streptomyces sp. HSW2009]|uniref:hypothetical protein n=1 Tax=Streptomyces sp. HSW2009 TaxID=3142890 RepID=UPI0032EAD5FB
MLKPSPTGPASCAWAAKALTANVLLGIPGVIPVWLLWYFAANWPLAAIGWTEPEPTENDGPLPWLLLGGPVVLLFALAWWLLNRPPRDGSTPRPRLYWPLSALATLAPTLGLVVAL